MEIATKPVVVKDRRSEEGVSAKHQVVSKKNQVSSRTKGTAPDDDAYANAPNKSRGGPLVLSPSVKSLRERGERAERDESRDREARKKTVPAEDNDYDHEVRTVTSKKDNKEHEQMKLLAK